MTRNLPNSGGPGGNAANVRERVNLDTVRRRWHTNYERGANDYTDAGCRVLAEWAFKDVPALLAIIDAQDKLLSERAS